LVPLRGEWRLAERLAERRFGDLDLDFLERLGALETRRRTAFTLAGERRPRDLDLDFLPPRFGDERFATAIIFIYI